jgi:hypothetical protein
MTDLAPRTTPVVSPPETEPDDSLVHIACGVTEANGNPVALCGVSLAGSSKIEDGEEGLNCAMCDIYEHQYNRWCPVLRKKCVCTGRWRR